MNARERREWLIATGVLRPAGHASPCLALDKDSKRAADEAADQREARCIAERAQYGKWWRP